MAAVHTGLSIVMNVKAKVTVIFTTPAIVPLITKPKKMTVAFATISLNHPNNIHIIQQYNIKNHHWHELCICFE
jgi:hypothetical protein